MTQEFHEHVRTHEPDAFGWAGTVRQTAAALERAQLADPRIERVHRLTAAFDGEQVPATARATVTPDLAQLTAADLPAVRSSLAILSHRAAEDPRADNARRDAIAAAERTLTTPPVPGSPLADALTAYTVELARSGYARLSPADAAVVAAIQRDLAHEARDAAALIHMSDDAPVSRAQIRERAAGAEQVWAGVHERWVRSAADHPPDPRWAQHAQDLREARHQARSGSPAALAHTLAAGDPGRAAAHLLAVTHPVARENIERYGQVLDLASATAGALPQPATAHEALTRHVLWSQRNTRPDPHQWARLTMATAATLQRAGLTDPAIAQATDMARLIGPDGPLIQDSTTPGLGRAFATNALTDADVPAVRRALAIAAHHHSRWVADAVPAAEQHRRAAAVGEQVLLVPDVPRTGFTDALTTYRRELLTADPTMLSTPRNAVAAARLHTHLAAQVGAAAGGLTDAPGARIDGPQIAAAAQADQSRWHEAGARWSALVDRRDSSAYTAQERRFTAAAQTVLREARTAAAASPAAFLRSLAATDPTRIAGRYVGHPDHGPLTRMRLPQVLDMIASSPGSLRDAGPRQPSRAAAPAARRAPQGTAQAAPERSAATPHQVSTEAMSPAEARRCAERRDVGQLAEAALAGVPEAQTMTAHLSQPQLSQLRDDGRRAMAELVGSVSRLTTAVATRTTRIDQDDDASQLAAERVMAAAQRWDPDGGAAWSSFAAIQARGANSETWRAYTRDRERLQLEPTQQDDEADAPRREVFVTPDATEGLVEAMGNRDEAAAIMANLPDKEREVVETVVGMRTGEPLNFRAAAQELGLHPHTVSLHWTAALERMRGSDPEATTAEAGPTLADRARAITENHDQGTPESDALTHDTQAHGRAEGGPTLSS